MFALGTLLLVMFPLFGPFLVFRFLLRLLLLAALAGPLRAAV